MPWATTSSRDAREASCAANCQSWLAKQRHGREPAKGRGQAEQGGPSRRLGIRIQGAQGGPREASTSGSVERSVSIFPG